MDGLCIIILYSLTDTSERFKPPTFHWAGLTHGAPHHPPWAVSVSPLLFKHSTTNLRWCFIHQTRWLMRKVHHRVLLTPIHQPAGSPRIGPCRHVRINNVKMPAICLPKHRRRSLPWRGNAWRGDVKDQWKLFPWLLTPWRKELSGEGAINHAEMGSNVGISSILHKVKHICHHLASYPARYARIYRDFYSVIELDPPPPDPRPEQFSRWGYFILKQISQQRKANIRQCSVFGVFFCIFIHNN